MTITTRLFTFFRGRPVGNDQFGNQYYTEKHPSKHRREKRWVIYNGAAEPSKIPPEWHSWLHYTHNTPPSKRTIAHHNWEKQHVPNLSGTNSAYVPPGHVLAGGLRAPAASDYEAWKP